MQHKFKIVDVFSSTSFRGNPVGVVLGADDLAPEQMQRIAAWTNLSETTFHLRPTNPEADYRLRIFTPSCELPFAGHPTLGSAHALIEAGMIEATAGRVVQECSSGLVPITVAGTGSERMLHLQVPNHALREVSGTEQAELATILGIPVSKISPALLIDLGARWVVMELESVAALLALRPDLAASARLETAMEATGITVFAHHDGAGGGIEVRSFAPSCGVDEDPICGSGNGAVAAYRLARGQIGAEARYTATQGRVVGRDGTVFVRIEGARIQIGGRTTTSVEGQIRSE